MDNSYYPVRQRLKPYQEDTDRYAKPGADNNALLHLKAKERNSFQRATKSQ